MTLGEAIKKLKDLTDEDFEGNREEIIMLIKTIEVPELVYEEQGEKLLELSIPRSSWN